MRSSSVLRAGEWVQVLSKEEILRTLDEHGQLEGLPFMPEMFEFCGKRLRVFKRAHKTCDPPNGMGGRQMLHAVHLEDARCTGDAHGGCQAKCLLFWKEAWLKRVAGEADSPPVTSSLPALSPPPSVGHPGCREQDVTAGTGLREDAPVLEDTTFICQSTTLPQATHPLRWWDLRQYAEDYSSGNVRVSQLASAFVFFLYEQVVSAGIGLGSALRWTYDRVQQLRGRPPYPMRIGKIPRGAKTPSVKLDLKAGELVKIKSYEDILATLNEDSHNRGMYFDAELVPFCGGTYRVLDRVTRIINEKTGKMMLMKNDCIMLDGVVCQACYAKYRRFCPRSIYPYWREIWLERISTGTESGGDEGRTC